MGEMGSPRMGKMGMPKKQKVISDIWKKWGRHIWGKGVLGTLGGGVGNEILRCGKIGVRHVGEMGVLNHFCSFRAVVDGC